MGVLNRKSLIAPLAKNLFEEIHKEEENSQVDAPAKKRAKVEGKPLTRELSSKRQVHKFLPSEVGERKYKFPEWMGSSTLRMFLKDSTQKVKASFSPDELEKATNVVCEAFKESLKVGVDGIVYPLNKTGRNAFFEKFSQSLKDFAQDDLTKENL